MDIIKEIVEWHKETFPDETESGQYRKVCSEIQEMWMAGTDKEEFLKEKADVCISLVSLAYRYDSELAMFLLIEMMYQPPCLEEHKALMNEIRRKMDLNKVRTWYKDKTTGEYRHRNF